MKTVFVNCNLFDGRADSTLITGAAVYVDDEVIIKIGKTGDPTDDYNVIDLGGKCLMPGLINMHAHFFGTGKPAKLLGGGGLQKAVIAFTKTSLGGKVLDLLVSSAARNELFSGVTTVRGMGDFLYSDVRVRNKVRLGKLVGPRMLVPGPAITVKGGHGDGTFSVTADTAAGLRELVRKNAAKGVDLIKICITGGVMDAKKKGEPGELRMNLKQATAVVDEAHKRGYKVASHTESPEGVEIAIKAGVDTIEHGSPFSEEAAAIFKGYNGAMITTFTPAIPLAKLDPKVTLLNPLCVYNSEIVLEHMTDGAKECLKHGINVGMGTDASCPFSTQYGMWREVRYFAKYVGVTNAFALYSATLGQAKILGLDDVTGSIEVGKKADMIAVDGNPLEDLGALRNVKTVVLRGKVYANPKVKRNKDLEAKLDGLWDEINK